MCLSMTSGGPPTGPGFVFLRKGPQTSDYRGQGWENCRTVAQKRQRLQIVRQAVPLSEPQVH